MQEKQKTKGNQMTNQEYLMQYKICKSKLIQCDESLRELNEGIDSLEINYSGMPHGSGTVSKVEDYVIRLEDKRERIAEEIVGLLELMTEISDAVRSVDNAVYSQVLYYRYIASYPWDEIAIKIGYDETYTRGALHGKALQEIKQVTK